MKTNDKTLADVQPGGRVRLGDALLPCPFCGESLTINGAGDGVHPRDSDCILAQHVVVADHAPHAAAWNRRTLSAQPSPGVVHPAVTPDTLVNGGALKMALNVLRRAGKNEVADELESTATIQPSPGGQGDAVVRAINSKDLYQVLMDVQNGIDSPALAGMANGAIRLIDKARAALAARQPVGEPMAWPNECSRTVPEALRFLANHARPSGGEDRFNSLHLMQLAAEIERMASKPLYAVPPAQGWVVADGQGERWRMWGSYGPEWTSDRDQALHFARRSDAEAFANDDEDAWLIQAVGNG